MKRVLGALLTITGAWLLFQFCALGMFHARGSFSEAFEGSLPFSSLGKNYPADALYLVGAFWCLLIGVIFALTAGLGGKSAVTAAPEGSVAARFAAGSTRKGGRVAQYLLLNGLLLLSSLFVAYVGARSGQQPSMVATFSVVAALQIVFGLLLLLFALLEKPKGIVSLLLGLVVYLGGVTVGVLAWLWGA